MIKRNIGIVAALALALSLVTLARAQERMQPNPNSGYLGVKLGPVTDEVAERLKLDSQDGIVVMEILPDSPAAKAGMKVDDIIRKVDTKNIEDVEGFVKIMWETKPDQMVKFSVLRDGKTEDVSVTLAKKPANLHQMDKDDDDKPKDDHGGAHGGGAHGGGHGADDKGPTTKPGQ